MKKIICLLLCFVLLSFSGCRQTPDDNYSSQAPEQAQSDPQKTQSISLLYSYGDTFDPYTASTDANRQLASLLYDSLTKTDNNFVAECVLALSAQTKDRVCTVKLRDAVFTDGSAVTSQDVIYSYNLAKNCPLYSYNFYEVTSVSAPDSKTVVFNLSQNDEYFINLLDFPIIKNASAGKKDADGKEVAPIGCGRYYLAEDGLSLKLNESYYGKKGAIKSINLINSPDAASTSHYVEVGATQIYYTDGDSIVRMSGKKTEVNLNRLVYIGINSGLGSLQTKQMRYAISSALDREAICQSAYYNNATSATGFFNPSFEPTKAVQTIENKPSLKITVENLAKIGYNNLNSNGYYANASGNNPAFRLLVNSENSSRVAAAKLIAAQCNSAGIQLEVEECTFAQYTERLASGNFQLYLGETQILDNMDFTNLVLPGGSVAYGVGLEPDDNANTAEPQTDEPQDTDTAPKTDTCEAILTSYKNGACGISDVAATLLTEMPQIPVCYLSGVLFYDSDITGGVVSSTSDIYLTIQNYEF